MFAPLIVLLAGLLTGCGNTIKMMYDPAEQKTVLNPKKGDVIQWNIDVRFPLANPCTEPSPTKSCSIKTNGGVVPYECSGCSDPEIVIDSATGTISGQSLPPIPSPPLPVYIACVSNQVKVSPEELKISKSVVSGGVQILWKASWVEPDPKPVWTVDNFTPSSICTNSPPFNDSTPICNVNPATAAGSTTYRVSINSCGSPITTPKITITP
jgi:hypothetical protein